MLLGASAILLPATEAAHGLPVVRENNYTGALR